MIDFSGIFRDPRWRSYRLEVTAPHRMLVRPNDDGGKFVVLVSLRKRTEGHWSISKRALHHVTAAERDGRIAAGHVLLAVPADNTWTAIASAPACEVQTRIGNMPANVGYWGEFYWLDATLQPTAGYRSGADDKEPF